MLIHVRLLIQSNFWLTSCYGACVLLANQLILKPTNWLFGFFNQVSPNKQGTSSDWQSKSWCSKTSEHFPKPFWQKAWCPFRGEFPGCKVVRNLRHMEPSFAGHSCGSWLKMVTLIPTPQTYSFRSNLSKIFFGGCRNSTNKLQRRCSNMAWFVWLCMITCTVYCGYSRHRNTEEIRSVLICTNTTFLHFLDHIRIMQHDRIKSWSLALSTFDLSWPHVMNFCTSWHRFKTEELTCKAGNSVSANMFLPKGGK